jgi:serine/threonine-protein kinase
LGDIPSLRSFTVEANDAALAAVNPTVGTVLEGRYRVDRQLARGGMSSVYAGVDLRLDRPVAIKIMESAYAADPAFVERFGREARAAARLDHRHVVAVYDQGVDRAGGDDRVYLVMELVNGGTLRDLLRQYRALPAPLALAILEPVLSALAAAHTAGLVHRDVKPENVLIGAGGSTGAVVKVADFGLVRAIASAATTNNSVVLGTVAYLSPEQLTAGFADARSDVYATGIMCYEMLTGHPPYTADTGLGVAYRHVHDDVPAPSEAVPDIPAELDELVLRATRRDPAARPADATEFLAEVTRIRQQLGIEPVPVPVPERAEPVPGDSLDEQAGMATVEVVGETGRIVVPAVTPASATTSIPARVAVPATVSAADATVRVVPIPPGQTGPRGTRAISRAELDAALWSAPPTNGTGPGHTSPEYHQERTKRRRTSWIWLTIVLLLAAIVAGVAWWLGIGQWTAVPQVAGLDTASADRALSGADLNPQFSQAYDNSVPAGRVVRTMPGAGSRALRGAKVTLLVSEGRPVVPDVAPGAQVAAVEQAIRALGLQPKLDPNANGYNNTIPAGAVLKVIPAPGTPVDVGSAVTIAVSQGPPPTPVPSVAGMARAAAFAALTQAGFQPYDLPAQFSNQVAAGSVISTSPAAGTTIAASGDRRVGVVVSNAVAVPNVTGAKVSQAQQALAAASLQIQVQELIPNSNGTVISQSTPPGTLVAPGTAITVAAFP